MVKYSHYFSFRYTQQSHRSQPELQDDNQSGLTQNQVLEIA